MVHSFRRYNSDFTSVFSCDQSWYFTRLNWLHFFIQNLICSDITSNEQENILPAKMIRLDGKYNSKKIFTGQNSSIPGEKVI